MHIYSNKYIFASLAQVCVYIMYIYSNKYIFISLAHVCIYMYI